MLQSLISDGAYSSKRQTPQLLSDAEIASLIKICHYAFSVFTRRNRKTGSGIDFNTLFNVYLKIVLKLVALQDKKVGDARRLDSIENYVNTQEQVDELSVSELFSYLIKQSMDREVPLLTLPQLKLVVHELV